MATSLSDLVSLLTDEIQIDPNNSIFSQDNKEKVIQRAYDRIQEGANYSLPENIKVYTLSTSSQENNLPSDFVHIANPLGIKIDESTPLKSVDYVELIGTRDLNDSGEPYLYYVRYDTTNDVNVIGFYPTPTSAKTITIPYCRALPTLSSSQSSILPNEYNEAIVNYAAYLLFRKIQGYESQAKNYFEAYQDKIKSIKGNRQIIDINSVKFGMTRGANIDWGYYNPRGY